MMIFRRAALIVGLTLILVPLANAQEQTLRPDGDSVRVTTARDKVHVSIGGDLFETRVEVASAEGEIVFESGILSGNSFDWEMSNSLGARVAPGDYTLTITYRTPAGKLMRRIEQVTVQDDGTTAQESAAGPSPSAVGTITGEGTSGKIAKFNGTNSITNSTVLTESAGKIRVVGALEIGATTGAGVSPTIVNPNNLANFALVRFYPASGTNVNTSFTVVPRGTGQPNNRAQFSITNTDAIADPSNVEFAALRARGSDFVFGTGKSGTGQIRPLMFSAGYMTDNATNANQLVLATNGSIGIGTDAPAAGIKFEVNGVARMTPGGTGGFMQFGTPNGETGITWLRPFISITSPDTRANIMFNGSYLTLAAGPGAGVPPNTGIIINTAGRIGIGTTAPAEKFHVYSSDDIAVYGQSGGDTGVQGIGPVGVYGRATVTDGIGVRGVTNINGSFGVQGLSNGSSSIAIHGSASGGGYAGFFNGKVEIKGPLTVQSCTGCTISSDHKLKTNFSTVNPRFVLDRLAALPIKAWNYKTDEPTVRHVGPMAQDFRAAFNLGADDKHIDMIDANGVTMAAIQGLYQMMLEKDRQIERLQAQLNQVKRALKRKRVARR